MALLKPISALRLLTLAVTILLVAAFFLPKGSFSVAFLLGSATGLSIGVQVIVWNRQLQWHDETHRSDTIQMNLNQPQR